MRRLLLIIGREEEEDGGERDVQGTLNCPEEGTCRLGLFSEAGQGLIHNRSQGHVNEVAQSGFIYLLLLELQLAREA